MSTIKDIAAAVAMQTLFFKLKEARKIPLKAPAIPINPAKNPDTDPPIIAFLAFDLNVIFGLK